MKRLLLLAFMSLLLNPLSNRIMAQCTGSFQFQVTGQTVSFYGSSSISSGVFAWYFGDNTIQYPAGLNEQHTYSQPGTYLVCFLFQDSASGCTDSVCQNVTVGSTSCTASFYTIDSLGYTFFINTSTGFDPNNVLFYWNFGDNSTGNTMSPSHVYQVSAMYTACLYISDTIQSFCDSTCQLLNITSQTSIVENEFVSIQQLGPNPVNDFLNFTLNLKESSRVRAGLYDLRGVLVRPLVDQQFSAGQTHETWDVSGLPAGTYMLRLETAGRPVSLRVFVLHP
jgi:PKD repeat protein